MKEFDELCKEFEKMDALSYGAYLAEKSVSIMPKLLALDADGRTGADLMTAFVLASVAADNKLTEEEYALIYPLLFTFFGDAVDYKECKKWIHSLTALKKVSDDAVDMLGNLDSELKDDIVIVCLMICAVDGKVSLAEKMWIKKLIR